MSSSSPSLTGFGPEQAAAYDARFAKLEPMREALHLLTHGILARLPSDARVLCVGAGTGAELLALASKFPGWRFTAVEPSGPMLDLCRKKANDAGVAGRCEFHEGFLESLPIGEPFHAATSFLVSQFVLDEDRRRDFFRGIAERLVPGGYLVSSDLSADLTSPDYAELFKVWASLFEYAGFLPEQIEAVRGAYGTNVAVTSPEHVASLIASAGFEMPVAFYQSVLIRGWFAQRLESAS
ncbi:class I SAM-dependent methyltransferase [Luteolibacter soli]|uniref:Methyltransferase domain-containing protein n=1 Tax=Luteolibacter soli TaxID=3135280 RepID=A0ABU9AMT1_9BACT